MESKDAKQLSELETEELLQKLKNRFEKNMHRHPGLSWADIEQRLISSPAKFWSVCEMERTGGEPDVVAFENGEPEIAFVDCAPESPTGRRSLCYDLNAWQMRKENKPSGNAMGLADEIGISLLSEQEYRALQKLDRFDLKTSSWVVTPHEIRQLGGAIFCDRRYNQVFTYHNGADSYYAARGFRGKLTC